MNELNYCTPSAAQRLRFEIHAVEKFHEYFTRNKFNPRKHTFTCWLWSYTCDSAGNRTGYRLCDLAGEWAKEGRNADKTTT